MKRKMLPKVICISSVLTMLVSNTGVLPSVYAAGEQKTVIYNGEQIVVTVEDDYVMLPDGEKILLSEFTGEFIESEPAPAPEPVPAETPDQEETPDPAETPDQEEIPDPAEIPDQEEIPDPGLGTEEEDSAGSVAAPEVPGEESVKTNVGESESPEHDRTIPFSVTAGTGFYIEELEEKYFLSFEDEFADVVNDIEEEFLEKAEGAQDPEYTLVKKENKVRFVNWQDILAIYLLNEYKNGADAFVMDAADKAGLARIFAQMNTGVIKDGEIAVEARTLEDYIEENQEVLNDSDREFLKKYTSPNCCMLCAAATGIRGFITQSLGSDVSEERARVVEAAYSLVGKIPYLWGGKSSVLGWDDRWDNDHGLDCSGFVTWSFINGYEDVLVSARIGHGTASQWGRSVAIKEEDAQPGDLVFLQTPGAEGINHVGIVTGQNDDGKLVAVHCNASDNGVVVESAYNAGFRYVRRPVMFEE